MARKKKDGPKTLGEQLEEALIANPDDLATHGAYADWLLEQGDPRGEFIGVQIDLEDEKRPAKERKELQKREQALWKKHGRTWLGELASFLLDQNGVPDYRRHAGQSHKFRVQRGWLDTLDVPLLNADFANALGRAPQTRLLRHLEIDGLASYGEFVDVEWDPDMDDEDPFPGLAPLEASPYLTNVRTFIVGGRYSLGSYDFNYNSASMDSSHAGPDLIRRMPRIEHLSLDIELSLNLLLFKLPTLTQLRVLELVWGSDYPLEVLADNPALGNLTTLLCHPLAADHGDGPRITTKAVRALLRSPHLKALETLRLHLTDIGDRGCKDIVSSGILKRLKVLDLAYGSVTDEGARTLAACPDLRHLETLDLSYNGLTVDGISALRAASIRVLAEEQHEPGDNKYLYEGDIE